LYASIVAGIARQWFLDPDTAYGVLLVCAAAFVFRRRLPELRSLSPVPSNAGFLVVVAALLIYVVGTITGDVFLLRMSLPVTLFGSIVVLYGGAHARALLPSLALLALAIPLPALIVTRLTMPLQLAASQIAAGVLSLSSVPVLRDGNLLTLPTITLEVAEACNGLRSVVSLVAVAAICGAIIPLRVGRTMLLIAAAIPIAVIGNGLRVAATGFMALSIGEGAVGGTVHEVTGFVTFVLMCTATVLFLRVDAASGAQMGTAAPVRATALAIAFVVTLIVTRLAIAPAAATLPDFDRLAMTLGPWTGPLLLRSTPTSRGRWLPIDTSTATTRDRAARSRWTSPITRNRGRRQHAFAAELSSRHWVADGRCR
jgi:exosortase